MDVSSMHSSGRDVPTPYEDSSADNSRSLSRYAFFGLGFTWRTALSFGDDDHDGIQDDLDGCRDQAEDYDGFQDVDGCPDLDNDADGVPDRRDLAPDLPEDFDGFEDGDGRPDRDNDGDGIRDEADACPNAAEDFDGDADADGCPEEA